MLTERFSGVPRINLMGSKLTRGDIDAAVWPQLKVAKAKKSIPNLWEIRVSSVDANLLGLSELATICTDSVVDAMVREGLSGEGLQIICNRSGELAAGHVKVTCENADEHTLKIRLATARATGAEVRGHKYRIMALCSWDGKSVPIVGSLSIGREPSCDLTVGDIGVSRQHGQIVDEGAGRVRYIDRSTNGSLVDGVLVHGTSITLHEGSQIEITPNASIVLVSE